MEEFFDLCPAKIFAVTGSDGKTTTTTIISKLLKTTGKRVFLGGNIGTPLLDKVDGINEDDFVVVELSSFQLISMKKGPFSAVVTKRCSQSSGHTQGYAGIHRRQAQHPFLSAKGQPYNT